LELELPRLLAKQSTTVQESSESVGVDKFVSILLENPLVRFIFFCTVADFIPGKAWHFLHTLLPLYAFADRELLHRAHFLIVWV
jgi:tetrahydromethanopterin S-methyltransferase subunit A